MKNLALLESCYKRFIEDMPAYLPEDIITVDLSLLQSYDLLHFNDVKEHDDSLSRFFNVIESDEKITLISDKFVVWIVPEKIHDTPITYTLIATNSQEDLKLEMCFVTSGVYNTSRLVLRVLEKMLHEIEETEELMKKMSQ